MPGRHVCPAVRVAIKVCLMSGRRRGAGKLTLSRQLDRDFIRQAVHMNAIPLYPRAELRHKAVYRRFRANGIATDTPMTLYTAAKSRGLGAGGAKALTGSCFLSWSCSVLSLSSCPFSPSASL